jgi:saccharopine dehydrogenase-like NADP-dependent oxidoreductase
MLLLGAGRSSAALIRYLLHLAEKANTRVVIADISREQATEKAGGHPAAIPIGFDVTSEAQRRTMVSGSDLVLSLLPPHLHGLVAADCVALKKPFLSASYISSEIQSLDEQARKNGVLLLNECGLDPGIDHMSAMEIIHRLQDERCEITSFRSYTGGLVAPESNDNPWGYKFSWNPRNVILAGQSTARYIRDGQYKYIPYSRMFTDIETIHVEGAGSFDGYANRDSLAYRHHYGISDIPTMLRGTLRHPGYCRAWDVFVKLGLTDDTVKLERSEDMTYAQVVASFIPASARGETLLEKVAAFCGLPPDGESMTRVAWTGIFDDIKTGVPDASPALILQKLLESKWKLNPGDRDMIVMQHQFEYTRSGHPEKLVSTLVVKGDDQQFTAMAKTVGWPLGICAKLMLQGKISLKGVHLPVHREIYKPVLKELKSMGVEFNEKTVI